MRRAAKRMGVWVHTSTLTHRHIHNIVLVSHDANESPFWRKEGPFINGKVSFLLEKELHQATAHKHFSVGPENC
jgi:hypothetical protein